MIKQTLIAFLLFSTMATASDLESQFINDLVITSKIEVNANTRRTISEKINCALEMTQAPNITPKALYFFFNRNNKPAQFDERKLVLKFEMNNQENNKGFKFGTWNSNKDEINILLNMQKVEELVSDLGEDEENVTQLVKRPLKTHINFKLVSTQELGGSTIYNTETNETFLRPIHCGNQDPIAVSEELNEENEEQEQNDTNSQNEEEVQEESEQVVSDLEDPVIENDDSSEEDKKKEKDSGSQE